MAYKFDKYPKTLRNGENVCINSIIIKQNNKSQVMLSENGDEHMLIVRTVISLRVRRNNIYSRFSDSSLFLNCANSPNTVNSTLWRSSDEKWSSWWSVYVGEGWSSITPSWLTVFIVLYRTVYNNNSYLYLQ